MGRALQEEGPSQAGQEEGEDIEDMEDTDDDLWLSRFFALESEDNSVALAWNQFCVEHGEPTNPRMHSGSFLQRFLESFDAGELPELELTTEEDLAPFYSIRRTRRSARWHWLQYCATHCYGIRNPRKVTTEMIHGFVDGYQRGEYEDLEMATPETVGLILELQRRDEKYRKAWQDFVGNATRGVKDPRAMPDKLASQF